MVMKLEDYEIRPGVKGATHYVLVWSPAVWPSPVCRTDTIDWNSWAVARTGGVTCLWCAQLEMG